MKRCTKCILPANFPGIAFGRDGVCSYCLHHKSIAVRGESELERILAPYRGKGRVADCIVTISGGRDSAYVLHQIVKKYQMNVLAVTFDNGLLTPEAHRNWRHFQDALGVRHHVIQAKKEAFRKDIAKNLHAWLKKPSLLMIPIFVSSDKIAEIYVNKFARQNDIPFIIRGGCEIEKSLFKSGFAGVYDTEIGKTNMKNTLKLLWKYGLEYVKNSRYFNSSVWYLLEGFVVYYFYRWAMMKDKSIGFFDYEMWDEKKIMSTLYNELNWEGPSDDTTITWRIDDAGAPLYNYLYWRITGFTENDTLYSNMVREGMISREEALKRAEEDNQPRVERIMDFLNYVGVDITFDELEKIVLEYKRKCKWRGD